MLAPSISPDALFQYFFVLWTGLVILGIFIFYGHRDAAFKRRWFPPYVTFGGILFAGFIAIMTSLDPAKGPQLPSLIVMLPGIAVVIYLNIKLTKFCSRCGRMVYTRPFFQPIKFCPGCGAALDDSTQAL